MSLTNQDKAELNRLLLDFAKIGGTAEGGVKRLAATHIDGQARDRLQHELIARGADLHIDPIGNMFGIFQFTDRDAPFILAGSHLDSQETGGRLDGTYGVLAALIAGDIISRRLKESPHAAKYNFAVVNWTNEEGARFQPSLTGSSVFTETLDLDQALSIQDAEGVSIGEAVKEIGYRGQKRFAAPVKHYLELHIEQGPELESRNKAIGIVTSAWAARKLRLKFCGAPSHTGPTPMPRRRDALLAASRAIDFLHLMACDQKRLHVSAARMTLYPNSPNVVASEVSVWFEFRHADDQIAFKFGDEFLTKCRSIAELTDIEIEIVNDERRPTQYLDQSGIQLVETTCKKLGHSWDLMKTVAGHDALALQRKYPSTLIFVPSINGLSHSPLENSYQEDLETGLDVLTETLWTMIINQ